MMTTAMQSSRLVRSIAKASTRRSSVAATASASTDCDPTQKLRTAFETYRQQHFSRETVVRFRKEFVKAFPNTRAVSSPSGNTSVRMFPADDINSVLTRIGMDDTLLLSKNEIEALIAQAGSPQNRMVSVSKLIQLV